MASRDEAIAAWNTRAAPPAMDREAVEKVREAERICRDTADRATHMLDREDRRWQPTRAHYEGLRNALRNAESTLSTLSADAIRQGEETFRPYSEWSEDDRDVLWWMLPVQSTPYLGSPLDLGFTVGAQLYNQFGDVIGKTEANVGGWPFSASDEANLVWSRLPATPAPAVDAVPAGEVE